MKGFADPGEDIDELLKELDINLNRLRLGYDQYFAGTTKREPYELKNRVQKTIHLFVDKPPRQSGRRFRFNQLNAKYQQYRTLWGRTMRQIEAGTYRGQRFRATSQQPAAAAAAATPLASPRPAETAPERCSETEDLYKALAEARKKTGEPLGDLTAQKLEGIIRQQTEAIRKKHGATTVRFRVVIENNRTKLKASLSKR